MKKLIMYWFILFILIIIWLYKYLVYELKISHPTLQPYLKSNYYLAFIKSWNNQNFIFYPWAFVSADAYMPLASCLSENWVNTYIAKMPLYFALFDTKAANRIIKYFSWSFDWKVSIWWHSLWWVAASMYINSSTWADRLILLWSYSNQKITWVKILSLIWENDWLVNYEKVMLNSWFLVAKDTKYILISWANHSQFWRYWLQKWDNQSTINAHSQLRLVCDDIANWLKNTK